MESRAKILGHPIHQVLVVFPLGLLAAASFFDLIFLVTEDPDWAEHSLVTIGGGVLGGVAAAIVGLIDWTGIPTRTRAARIGMIHGVGNLIVLSLFSASWVIRYDDSNAEPSAMALILSFAGLLLLSITAWFGGELVTRLGVGVDPGANLNASSSLSKESTMTDSSHDSSGVGTTKDRIFANQKQ